VGLSRVRFTERAGDVLELEADHRRHAVVEQSIAELKSAGMAHMPSGNFMADAAWLALAVMAFNLGRAVGHLTGPALASATAATQGLHHADPPPQPGSWRSRQTGGSRTPTS